MKWIYCEYCGSKLEIEQSFAFDEDDDGIVRYCKNKKCPLEQAKQRDIREASGYPNEYHHTRELKKKKGKYNTETGGLIE